MSTTSTRCCCRRRTAPRPCRSRRGCSPASRRCRSSAPTARPEPLKASVAIVCFPEDGSSAKDLLDSAAGRPRTGQAGARGAGEGGRVQGRESAGTRVRRTHPRLSRLSSASASTLEQLAQVAIVASGSGHAFDPWPRRRTASSSTAAHADAPARRRCRGTGCRRRTAPRPALRPTRASAFSNSDGCGFAVALLRGHDDRCACSGSKPCLRSIEPDRRCVREGVRHAAERDAFVVQASDRVERAVGHDEAIDLGREERRRDFAKQRVVELRPSDRQPRSDPVVRRWLLEDGGRS